MTGGTAEWRKCGLLGVEMVGGRRFCPVRSDSPHTRAEATSALCAACPVPALVEAVRAVDKHFVGHFQGYNHCGHCSCQSWALRPIHHAKDCPMIPVQAALAAIEEAK